MNSSIKSVEVGVRKQSVVEGVSGVTGEVVVMTSLF